MKHLLLLVLAFLFLAAVIVGCDSTGSGSYELQEIERSVEWTVVDYGVTSL